MSTFQFTIAGVHVTIYDILLIVAVSLMGTVLAYLHHPKWKAMMLTLPIPFSLAFLSTGGKMGITNVTGLLVLLLFTYAVYLLHQRWRFPIIPTILVSAASYCLIGSGLAMPGVLPETMPAFWVAFGIVMVVGLALYLTQAHRNEPGHRTPLPVWLKLPLMAGVVVFLVVIKLWLKGFMTVFPMVGVIAAYEARYSLWANCRAIPLIMISLGPMMAVMFIVQHWFHWAALPALAAGWIVLFSILLPMTREIWTLPAGDTPAEPEAAETI